jgi:hypothetical protein
VSLDGTRVVVLADPRRRIVGAHTAKLGDAGQRRAGAADAAAAGNLDSLASSRAAMRLLERGARFAGAQG